MSSTNTGVCLHLLHLHASSTNTMRACGEKRCCWRLRSQRRDLNASCTTWPAQVRTPEPEGELWTAVRSVLLASYLLDELPALQSSCGDGDGLNSAGLAFSARLRELTHACVAALAELVDKAIQAELTTDSDDEADSHAAVSGSAALGDQQAGAVSRSVWSSVTDGLTGWLSGAESALVDWATALGITDCSGGGCSVLAEVIAEVSGNDAALQHWHDADTAADDEDLVLERLATAAGQMRFVPYALSLLSDLLDCLEAQRPLPSSIPSSAAASQPGDSGATADEQPSASGGSEQPTTGGTARQGGGTPSGGDSTAGDAPGRAGGSRALPDGGAGVDDTAVGVAETSAAGSHKWQEVREDLRHQSAQSATGSQAELPRSDKWLLLRMPCRVSA